MSRIIRWLKAVWKAKPEAMLLWVSGVVSLLASLLWINAIYITFFFLVWLILYTTDPFKLGRKKK